MSLLFFMFFLDTCINLVKYLQRISINWRYLHQDAGKTYSEISKMRWYWKYLKASIFRHMKMNIGDFAVTKEQSEKTTKATCSTKVKYLTTNQTLARKDGKFFCKKSNDKSRYSTIHYRGDSCQTYVKDWPEVELFSEERNPDQKWPEIET